MSTALNEELKLVEHVEHLVETTLGTGASAFGRLVGDFLGAR
ncbi:hypothetical protein ACIQOU_01390 [Streptomyces sp. NPDC091279]